MNNPTAAGGLREAFQTCVHAEESILGRGTATPKAKPRKSWATEEGGVAGP